MGHKKRKKSESEFVEKGPWTKCPIHNKRYPADEGCSLCNSTSAKNKTQ